MNECPPSFSHFSEELGESPNRTNRQNHSETDNFQCSNVKKYRSISVSTSIIDTFPFIATPIQSFLSISPRAFIPSRSSPYPSFPSTESSERTIYLFHHSSQIPTDLLSERHLGSQRTSHFLLLGPKLPSNSLFTTN